MQKIDFLRKENRKKKAIFSIHFFGVGGGS
jgi:hypothetical protein